MAVTDWKSPGTVGEKSLSGSFTDWANENNIKFSNNSYASNNAPGLSYGDYTTYLYASNFGLSIPAGATIDGIEARIERYGQSGAIKDYRVSLVNSSGGVTTADKKNATNWASSDPDTYVKYGSPSDLWGETWSVSDINDADFGIVLSAQGTDPDSGNYLYVDHIQIRVYYTESTTPTVGVKYPLPAFKR